MNRFVKKSLTETTTPAHTMRNSHSTAHLVLWLFMVFLLCIGVARSVDEEVDPQSTLACHQRHYEYVYNNTIVSPTGQVYHCEGPVRVLSCWGRCDSHEVPDYRMPYKVADHPVCTFSTRVKTRVRLANCHPDHPSPEVEVVEAGGCGCMPCSSYDTSCLSLP